MDIDSDSETETESSELDSDSETDSSIEGGLKSEPQVITLLKNRLWRTARLRYYRQRVKYRSKERAKFDEVKAYTQKEYLTTFRMTKQSTNTILEAIRYHSVFHTRGKNRQRSPEIQLWVALCHLGAPHNGKVFTSSHFGIGEGTVTLYTNRVVTAVLSLQNEYLRMPRPGTTEYQNTVDLMRFRFGFPNCLGSVDGTIVPLSHKPCCQGERYFTRKKTYGLNATAIVDGEAKILFLVAGYPGSVHDSRVLNESAFYTRSDRFFENPQGYIIGDSAYRISNRVMKPFSKREVKGDHTGKKLSFNAALSSARVKTEHAFGLIKARFRIMKLLTVLIDGEKSANDMIYACCILHDFLLSLGDAWEPDEAERAMIGRDCQESYERCLQSGWAAEMIQPQRQPGAAREELLGKEKRDFVMDEVLKHHPQKDIEDMWWMD